MYLYGSRSPKINDKFLYHFTKAESLMEILKGMTLKFSSFTDLNDLNETNVCCEWSSSMDSYFIKKYISEHCKLISFSQNYNSVDGKVCYAGTNHPRMWAQSNERDCEYLHFLQKKGYDIRW